MPRYWYLPFVAGCLVILPAPANGGLVIEFDPHIDASGVFEALPAGPDLQVESAAGSQTIRLPPNALPLLALWARHYSGDPLVISGEIERVSSSKATYFSPEIPPFLRDALLLYDGEHATLACGAVPADEQEHPLVALAGDNSLLPSEEAAVLLSANNHSAQAFWYQQLAMRYITPPRCEGGQLTIRVVASDGALPLRLEVESHAYIQTQVWYRKINTMSEFELWVAALPYQGLKRDIEERWDVYRQRFTPIGELSSIVEAFGTLQALYRQKPEVWARFSKELVGTSGERWIDPVEPSSFFLGDTDFYYSNTTDQSTWDSFVFKGISGDLDSPAQLDLAIALAIKAPHDRDFYLTLLGAAAQSSPSIRAKWLLAQALWVLDDPQDLSEASRLVKLFFEAVISNGDFRLRADGLRLLNEKLALTLSMRGFGALDLFMARERSRARADFIAQVSSACSLDPEASSSQVLLWERFTREALATGFANLLAKEGSLDSEFASVMACIHHRRALASHAGKDLFFRHAHFRFLKYLADSRPLDTRLKATIHSYRAEIANRLNLKAWDEEEAESTRHVEEEGPVEIEGDLIPLTCLFTDQPSACAQATFGQGQPLGIQTADAFHVLLIEGKAVATPCPNSGTLPRARAEGIQLDNRFALSPSTIQVLCKGTWLPLEFTAAN